ncbi:MAG: hypothetical protein ACM3TT_06805 [Syntrophothermus sp.]
MIVTTQQTLALRCPACGKLNYHQLSLFDFSGRRTVKVECGCGFNLFTISTRDHHSYLLQVHCTICEAAHVFTMSAQDIWQPDLASLYCPDTEMEMGFLGKSQLVHEVVDKKQLPLEDLLADMDYDDFFAAPEVMLEVLRSLQKIASRGHLYCECGNFNIEVGVFPEKIELHCPKCDSLAIVYGETEEDLRVIQQTRTIELVEGGFTSLDGRHFHSRNRKG